MKCLEESSFPISTVRGRTLLSVEWPRAVTPSWVSLFESSWYLCPSSDDGILGFAWFLKTVTNDISFLGDSRYRLLTLDRVVSTAFWGPDSCAP